MTQTPSTEEPPRQETGQKAAFPLATERKAHVYAGQTFAGTLERKSGGCVFSYGSDYLRKHHASRGALSASLPLDSLRFTFRGANVHPYLAGLLPEGWRLNTLLSQVKASADDYFAMLMTVGSDPIGDVAVCMPGSHPQDIAPEVSLDGDALDFAEIKERSAMLLGRRGYASSMAGVQAKVSASMISHPIRIPKAKDAAWILKLTPADHEKIVENEHYFMQLARRCGLPVADTRLIHDKHGQSARLVRRFDRIRAHKGPFTRVPQEDMCQALGVFPADKYHVTSEAILERLSHYEAPKVQRVQALRYMAYSYLIANDDLHGKNFSVYLPPKAKGWRLSPAYDLLSTLPYGDRHMALRLDNRDAKIKRDHFLRVGERFQIPERAVTRMLDGLIRKLRNHATYLEVFGLDEKKTSHLRRTMEQRMTDLS